MNRRLELSPPPGLLDEARSELTKLDFARRFWAKDPSLWPAREPAAVAGMLGWVDVLERIQPHLGEIETFAEENRAEGYTRVLLAGMGGSSLAPYVFASLFRDGAPLHVLDSTHPESVRAALQFAQGAKTRVIVASKSGSTAEPTAFEAYFFEKLGDPNAFVAITDPGSPFEAHARARGYGRIFLNFADIGGRFSALSLFGLVPAALVGADVRELIERARQEANRQQSNDADAFVLGYALGRYPQTGKDKLTIFGEGDWSPFGLWLEQLIAESTGKEGKGILPVAGERPGPAGVYGDDRVFASIRGPLGPASPRTQSDPADAADIAAEMLFWEIVTATAGHVLGINPFDQPNVQESKDVTKAVIAELKATGALPAFPPDEPSLAHFLDEIRPPEYVSLQAYLGESEETNGALAELQATVRDRYGVATTLGYGPRFLHSTGQYHKGGPNQGRFVQLVDTPTTDDVIPGDGIRWSEFCRAQALGDRSALEAKGRRVLTLELGQNPLDAVRHLQNSL